jgi:hypothetical protein
MSTNKKSFEAEREEKKKKKGASRGVTDEFEILTLIIAEHPNLKLRVLNRIRELHSTLSVKFFDEVKKKQNDVKDQQQNMRNRKPK